MIGQSSSNQQNLTPTRSEEIFSDEVQAAFDKLDFGVDERTKTLAEYTSDTIAEYTADNDPNAVGGVHLSARVRSMSGNFAQPSGAFAQPSGAFAQPSGAFAQPSGAFAQFAGEYKEISGGYRVGEPIGRGGCAIVLEAWRLSDNMHVVIKVLQINSGIDEQETHIAIERFMREAKLIASLNEEHIVKCVDYGSYQGTPCMVLEYVDGLSLDRFLEKYGAIPLQFATGLIEQLLSALIETHNKKIIHRDIKPGNIMVFDSPPPYEIRVLDFGISSVLDGFQSKTLMTQQGNVRGTPSYMAPELFTGETRASVESDLYAVGLVYLECLTGEIAVNDKSFMRVAYKQVNEQLEIPGNIPPVIADIIFKLCAKKAEDRYHSAQVVLDDLHEVLEQALKDEEKCLKAWEKSEKKRYRQKKRRSNGQQITSQRLLSKRNLPKLLGIIILIAAICCLPMVYVYYNIILPQNQVVTPSDEPVNNAAPNTDEETPKQAADDEQNLKTRTHYSIHMARSTVQNAWNMAVTTVNNIPAEPPAAAPTSAPAPAPAKTKPRQHHNRIPTKGSSDVRPVDPSGDLPF